MSDTRKKGMLRKVCKLVLFSMIANIVLGTCHMVARERVVTRSKGIELDKRSKSDAIAGVLAKKQLEEYRKDDGTTMLEASDDLCDIVELVVASAVADGKQDDLSDSIKNLYSQMQTGRDRKSVV